MKDCGVTGNMGSTRAEWNNGTHRNRCKNSGIKVLDDEDDDD